MPTERQRKLLAFLDAFGGELGKMDLQKLLVLHAGKEDKPPYDFVPYRYGAFSFTSNSDLRKLAERGLVSEKEKAWLLTEQGRSELGGLTFLRAKLRKFATEHEDLRGEQLVAETYRRFPYFAIHSDMAPRLLKNDEEALSAIEKARPRLPGPGLRTIGYEGRSLERYLNLLIKAGVTILCDVRRNPLSRKYGFSKKTLSHACESVGIRYEHLPELGIASQDRKGLQTQEDYDALFEVYEAERLPLQGAALAKISEWIDQGNLVALTCFEAEPHQCHRHCVAEALEAQLGAIASPTHL